MRHSSIRFWIITAVSFLAAAVAHGQGGFGPTGPAFNLATFWDDAFGVDYVPGESALILGDTLPDGSIEVLVYEPGVGAFSAGSIDDSVSYLIPWMVDGDFSFTDTETSETYDADGIFDHRSFAGALTTASGTFHLSGISNVVATDFSSPLNLQVTHEVFTPVRSYATLTQATDAAEDFSTSITRALEVPTFIEPDSPDPGCAGDCEDAYDLAKAIALNNYNLATAQCDFSIAGIGTGCGVAAVLCAPGGLAPAAICCVIGGALGAFTEYTICMYNATLAYETALDNALLTYITCMEGCGYIIVYD